MKSIIIAVFIWMTLGAMGARADQQSKPVVPQGETVVTAAVGKLTATVTITTREVQIGKPSDGRPEVIQSSCTYSKYPCSVVDRLQIVVNGNALFIPRSTFCDLADLNDAKIKANKNGLVLRLGGGDASEAYILTIEFDGTRVKRRSLASATLPDKPLQETVYHTVVEGD